MEEKRLSLGAPAPSKFALEVSDHGFVGIGDTVYTEEGAALVVEGFQLEECGWRVRCDCGDHSVMLYRQDELTLTEPKGN